MQTDIPESAHTIEIPIHDDEVFTLSLVTSDPSTEEDLAPIVAAMTDQDERDWESWLMRDPDGVAVAIFGIADAIRDHGLFKDSLEVNYWTGSRDVEPETVAAGLRAVSDVAIDDLKADRLDFTASPDDTDRLDLATQAGFATPLTLRKSDGERVVHLAKVSDRVLPPTPPGIEPRSTVIETRPGGNLI